MRAAVILLFFALILVPAVAWADPTVSIYTDAETYQSGDTIEISLSAQNFGAGMSVAVYIGLLTPEGWIYTLSPWGQSGWSGMIEAWIPEIFVPSPFNMNPTPLLWVDVPSSMPPIQKAGTYNFASVLTYPGTFDWASDLSMAPFSIGGAVDAPTAYIDSISPNPATQGSDVVEFYGHGEDDGSIRDYSWRSSIDGDLDDRDHFSMPAADLSVSVHTIYFKVKDNDGNWSAEASAQLTIQTGGATGTVDGYVYETGTSTPISGVQVSIGSISDTTSSDGFYELISVPVGLRTIEASATGYQPYSETMSVSEGTTEHDVYMTAGDGVTNLEGFVTDWDKQPVQRAKVKIAGMETSTDARGHYQFPNVPQGNRLLTVTGADCHDDFEEGVYLYLADQRYDVQLSLSELTAPSGFTAEAETLMLNVLSWDQDSCAVGYDIYISYDGGTHKEKLNSEPVEVGEFQHRLASNCDDMSYAVCALALNRSETDRSAWVDVTPMQGGHVSEDLAISGEICLTSDLMIDQAAVLTIAPNSLVRLGEHCGIFVYGGLTAEGETEDSIAFEPLESGKPWENISFWDCADSQHCRLRHCSITGGGGTYQEGDERGGAVFCFGSSPIISDNTIAGNRAYRGGGIYCYESSPMITGNSIIGNSGQTGGGGIYCWQYSSPTIENNTIQDNDGSGISCYESSPTISNNIIANNSAGANSGGIYCRSRSSPIIENNTIQNNDGSGIFCFESSPTISNNIITNNSTGTNGGGIACSFDSGTIINNTIQDNSAADDGGGIYCYGHCWPTITDNVIRENSAHGGGGICCDHSFPTITNNRIEGNSGRLGAGILCFYFSPATGEKSVSHEGRPGEPSYIPRDQDSPTISNNVILENYTDGYFGGGIYCYGSSPMITNNTVVANATCGIDGEAGCSPTILDCIIWGNGVDCYCPASYCCIERTTIEGEGNIHDDPMFVTGPLGEYYLDPDSPCIDAGSQSPSAAGLSDRTTQTDGTPDTGTVDMGYHYAIE